MFCAKDAKAPVVEAEEPRDAGGRGLVPFHAAIDVGIGLGRCGSRMAATHDGEGLQKP